MMRQALVFGGAGRLGSALVPALEEQGFKVAAPTRDEIDLENVTSIRRAVKDAIKMLDEPPVVAYNCVALHSKDCEADPARAIRVNAVLPQALAKVFNGYGTKLVHVSTDYVFGATLSPQQSFNMRPQDLGDSHLALQGFEPESPVDPVGVYGRTKAAGELAVLSLGSNALVVRTSSLFGTISERHSDFARIVIGQLDKVEAMYVVDDVRMTPSYIPDVVTDLVDEGLWSRRGIVHVCGRESMSWYEFARMIAYRRDKGLIKPCKLAESGDAIPRPWDSSLSQWSRTNVTRNVISAVMEHRKMLGI